MWRGSKHGQTAGLRIRLGGGPCRDQTFGGFGFAEEYDSKREFREVCLHQVAPVSTNMILLCIAQHVLDLPRSF